MKLRVTALFTLAALSIGLLAFLAPPAPAWACSCVGGDEDERADLIVVGTVTAVTDKSVRLAVESVEKGSQDAPATVDLAVTRYEMSCGYEFRTGNRYRVNSADGRTGLCAGIRPLPATPPVVAPAPTPVTAAPAPEPAPPRWWLAAGAALTVLGAGLVAVVVRRRTGRAT